MKMKLKRNLSSKAKKTTVEKSATNSTTEETEPEMSSSRTSIIKKYTTKTSTFGKVRDISAIYNIERGDEVHTKILDIPSPFEGSFRIDHDLEPSQYLLMEFKGIHDSYYMGINDIHFEDNEGNQIPYTNIQVDGQTVDGIEVMPAMPAVNGWWAVVGKIHFLLFDFGKVQKVKKIAVCCANASATPKEIHISDGIRSANDTEGVFDEKYCFQLSGEPGKDPSKLKFFPPSSLSSTKKKDERSSSKKLSLNDLIAMLNDTNHQTKGFESFLSTCGKYFFVFYRGGLRTRAYNYYFGKDPSIALNILTSSPSNGDGGKTIQNVEARAMTLEELQAVRAIIMSCCLKEKWKSPWDGSLLQPQNVNLYDLTSLVIMPLTKKRNNCSFKELFPSGGSDPTFYVIHWWGESVLDFIRCCEMHAEMHDLHPSEAKYWVCAYAHRQHDLGTDLASNPDESSFRKAMLASSKGVVLMLDTKNMVYNRIWCAFELFKTIETQQSRTFDMITTHGGHLLSSLHLPGEEPYQMKCRESRFPFEHVCQKGFEIKLEEGEASMNTDRIRILNLMANRMKNIDDRKISLRLKKGDMEDVDFVQDCNHYQVANNGLRCRLALKCVAKSLDLSEDESIHNFYGYDLLQIIAADKSRNSLEFDDLLSNEGLTDEIFGEILALITTNITKFGINASGCHNLTDKCLYSLELPHWLTNLTLDIGYSINFTNDAMIHVASKLPPSLTSLHLDITSYKSSDGSYTPDRFGSHLSAMAANLPQSLVELKLLTNLTTDEGEEGLLDFAKALPKELENLYVHLIWANMSGELMAEFGKHLPRSLKKLYLRFEAGHYAEADQFKSFGEEVLQLRELEEFTFTSRDNGTLGYYRIREYKSVEEMKMILFV